MASDDTAREQGSAFMPKFDANGLMTAVARFGDDEQQHRAQQLIAAGKISGS